MDSPESVLTRINVSNMINEATTIAQFFKTMELAPDDIEVVEVKTRGQPSNPNWHMVRKFRITASNFVKVFWSEVHSETVKTLIATRNLDDIPAIKWGRENESKAKESFEKVTGKHVEECGIFLHPSGLLGASPDGIVDANAIIEIKCPYKYRNHDTLDEALEDIYFCLRKEGDTFFLKKCHNYYDQVQGQLFLTNREVCYFVVYIPNQLVIAKVTKDPNWTENIDKLLKFARESFYPYLFNYKDMCTVENR